MLIYMYVHINLAASVIMVSRFVCRVKLPTELLEFKVIDNILAGLIYRLWEWN